MAKLPRYLKTEYIGKRQLENGRWVADFDVRVVWWGWPFILLWGLLHRRKAGIIGLAKIDAMDKGCE